MGGLGDDVVYVSAHGGGLEEYAATLCEGMDRGSIYYYLRLGGASLGSFEPRRPAASLFNDLRLPSGSAAQPCEFSVCSLALPRTSMQGGTIIYSPARPSRQDLTFQKLLECTLSGYRANRLHYLYLVPRTCRTTPSINHLLCSARFYISTFSMLSVASRMNLHSVKDTVPGSSILPMDHGVTNTWSESVRFAN